MAISNAEKYRNPMPFDDLDEFDYFCSPNHDEGVLYRKIGAGRAIQITDNFNYQMDVDSHSWDDGVYKVEILTMTYKEL